MTQDASFEQSDSPQRWLGSPLIVHRCPNCKRLFDSPSICMDDGSQTEPMVRPIKLVLWKQRGPGDPKGLGYDDEDADAVIAVDFDSGAATVYPIMRGSVASGGYSITGPPRTPGLELVVIVEKDHGRPPPKLRELPETEVIGPNYVQPGPPSSFRERLRRAFNG